MEKYIAPDRKRIPYGMMNFAVIRRDDCYYVDKTRIIPMIEEARSLNLSNAVAIVAMEAMRQVGFPHLLKQSGRLFKGGTGSNEYL